MPPVHAHKVFDPPAAPGFDKILPVAHGLAGGLLVVCSTAHVGTLGLVLKREYPTTVLAARTGSPSTYMPTCGSVENDRVVPVTSSLIVFVKLAFTAERMLRSVTFPGVALDIWIKLVTLVPRTLVIGLLMLSRTLLCAAAFCPTRIPSLNPTIVTSSIELLDASRSTAALGIELEMQVSP